jgi:hypothetical protein
MLIALCIFHFSANLSHELITRRENRLSVFRRAKSLLMKPTASLEGMTHESA